MKNIGIAILAVSLGTLGSMASHAQTNNTAYGSGALGHETTGNNNSAFGAGSLWSNQTGNYNSAFGESSLFSNTSGYYNTAIGFNSLSSNSGGNYNTAIGYESLSINSVGSWNTAIGYNALWTNNGNGNTALGGYALGNNISGWDNIAIGNFAGYYNPYDASYNIDIGNYGSANDHNPTIRIGNPGSQTAFYAAGIDGTVIGGPVPVYINSNGQLGTVNSSIRFKEDVHDMAAASEGLMRLRPVTYRYKQPYADGSKPIDYGLIAEEVAQVYPDMVVKDADGQIQTVQYQKLTPMLLNEVQKENRRLEEQEKTVQQQAETIQQLEKRLAALEAAQPSASSEN